MSESNAGPRKKKPAGQTGYIARVLLGFLTLTALIIICTAPVAFCEGNPKDTEEFFSRIDAGVTQEWYYLADKPATLDYDINKRGVYIGSREGSRLYLAKTDTGIAKDSETTKFSTSVHMDEFGVALAGKFAALPRQTLSLTFADKQINLDPYKKYNYRDGVHVSTEKPGHADVGSRPVGLSWSYDMPNPWTVGAGYTSERVELDTSSKPSVSFKIYSFRARAAWEKTAFEGSFSKIVSGEGPDNANLELRGAYRPRRHLELFLTVGFYSDGLPAAGGAFSDLGGQFIFDYLGDVSGTEKMYTERFGYFSIGATFTLK